MDDVRLNRHDLSDAEWARLEPLLPRHPRQGHRWNDHRVVIDGVFHRTRTGCPWRDLPERFGNWKTVYNRHRRWSGDGTWERVLDALRVSCDEAEGSVDGRGGRDGGPGGPARSRGAARAAGGHPGAPGGDRPECPGRHRADPNDKDPPPAGTKPGKPGEREGLGRSRGGLTTKVHLLADVGCRPLARVTSAGQRHDSVAFIPLMERLAIARRGRGRPRTRPGQVLADKAYSSRAIRSHLRRRRIKATIPEPADPQPAPPRQQRRPATRLRP